MIDQRKSPLFRLPRELRDEIYAHYSHEDDGLLYDFPSRSLRFVNERGLELSYTCKAIAEEMRGVSLQVNTVTFAPSCGETEGSTSKHASSRSCRFEHLLYTTRWTKMIMLHYAADCVTKTDLAIVVEAYPAVGNVFHSCFRAIQRDHDFSQVSRLIHMPRDVFTASFCDAVQYTLDLAANHPEFEELIFKACELPQHYPWYQPPFIQGSHLQVLGWQPMPWLIPSHANLCGMEDLLTVVQGPTRERARTYEGINHYISATAICIAALSRLMPTTRKHLRNIILQEDCRSLGNPEVHAEGLIGYCTENRKLHFLMQASFSTMLAPSFWSKPDALLTYPSRGTIACVHSYIRILVDWLMRTAALTNLGCRKRPTLLFLTLKHHKLSIYGIRSLKLHPQEFKFQKSF